MFNVGAGEIVVILVAALVLLGPKRLPELARGLGKFMREFRRQTDEVRMVVEREFYRMDQDVAVEDHPYSNPDRALAPHDEQGRLIVPAAAPEGTVSQNSILPPTATAAAPAPLDASTAPTQALAPAAGGSLGFEALQARAAQAMTRSEPAAAAPDEKKLASS